MTQRDGSVTLPEMDSTRIAEDDSSIAPTVPPQRAAVRRWHTPRWVLGVLAPLLVLVGLGAWALSSPVGSSPDDDYHLASIWCGLGERPGLCESVPGHPNERMVDKELTGASACFAFHPEVSGACTAKTPDGPSVDSNRGNWVTHLYPALYYAVVGVLATPHIGLSVLAIRGGNALLYVGLIAALYLLLPSFRRRALVWTQAASMIPLGVFMVSSDNPSAWAVASAAVLWPSLVGYYQAPTRWRRVGFGAVAAVATVMGAGARADAALFCIMSVAVAVILTVRPTVKYALLSILPVVLVGVSGLLYLTGAQAEALSVGLAPGQNPQPPVALIWGNLTNLPALYAGTLGTWNLGWLDTSMPAVVWVAMLIVCGVAVFLGIKRPLLRKIIVLVCVGLGLIVYPMVLLFQSNAYVGTQVQPRYVLPLLVIFVGVALHQDRAAARVPARLRHIVAGAVLVAMANAFALHENIRRYVSGVSTISPNLDDGDTWWWGIGVSPMAVWSAGVIAFTVGLALALLLAERGAARSGAESAGLDDTAPERSASPALENSSSG